MAEPMRFLMALVASSILLGQITVGDAAQSSDVYGIWGAFDEKSGKCTPDAVNVTVSTGKFAVESAGHGIYVQPVGQPACQGDRCTVNTTARSKSRTWTWIFKTADTAVIQGNFPHELAKNGFIQFEQILKKGCP